MANLGSTSFKYKLFAMPAEEVLAVGSADRIGQGGSSWAVEAKGKKAEGKVDLADHGAAIDLHLKRLVELGAIQNIAQVQAVGFKAVHGGPISGAVRVDEKVIATMQQFADVAPAHNPPYIAAMRAFAKELPGVPQVAAFETAFHQTIPQARQVYAIPWEWTQMGVRRYGFHGASHRYIGTRMAEIAPKARRIISCHLGGSCSICAIEDGKSVANSFGMTAQSGVFHNNRVGDFDAFAMLKLLKAGLDVETIFKRLGKEGGLLGISGVSPDMREVEKAAAGGNERAKLALEAFVESCRHYVGAYLALMGGADAVVFTGGIGQFGKEIRQAICARMEYAGLRLDEAKNQAASGKDEVRIEATNSKVAVWVLPTNEELIVARQAAAVLAK
ncbi:MAG: acetate/propionate family kinase [Phycisphaeraceae bacterium]|nr:acetate/propionate family kinase [Phycisphaeraceae bacterium]